MLNTTQYPLPAAACELSPECCHTHAPASDTVRLFGLAPESVVDGPGLRFAIFTQGCHHHCPECHNPSSHAAGGGYEAKLADLLAYMAENPLLSGITLSGGEPFLQAGPLCQLAKGAKARGLNVLTYSGYTLEQLYELAQSQTDIAGLLSLSDFLIDSPYIAAQRDLTLSFRGSTNQRFWRQHNHVFVLDEI